MNDTDETVEIPLWAASEARQEFEWLIERTGGGDVGADEANEPLAEVLDRTNATANRREYINDRALGAVNEIIQTVAEERNVDISGADPLTDRTSQARKAFDSALEDMLDGDLIETTFAPRYVSPIRTGKKTKTIRYNFGDVEPGDDLLMIDSELGQSFARATVRTVWGMTAATLVHDEVTVLEDGHRDYDDVDELVDHLGEFYPDADLDGDSLLTIIEWGDVEVMDHAE